MSTLLAVIRLEHIADDCYAYRKYATRINPLYERCGKVYQLTQRGLRPWVARLTGLNARGGLVREFVHGQRDYSQANSVGSRGVYEYIPLKDGVYEVNERLTWKRARRYFIRIQDAQIAEIGREEVIKCLSTA
jgi:hypothetical protein